MTAVTVPCPYTATIVAGEASANVHLGGGHRCTQQIPPGGDHLGEHTCFCGAAFVVTSSVRPAGSLVWSSNPYAGATVVHTAPPPDGVVYLLWSQSHNAWWKPDGRGYTESLDEAGRLSEADAVRYVVRSAQSGIRDKVTFMVAAPDNWAAPPVVNIVTECPDCGATGRYDGRVHIGGRGVYSCPNGHKWQDAKENPDDHGYTPIAGGSPS